MVASFEKIVRYLSGLTTILVAILLTAVYYLWLFAPTDIPPPSLVLQLVGIIVGAPLLGTGIALIAHSYRLALYFAVSTDVIYAVITTLFNNVLFGIDIRHPSILFGTYTPTIFLSFFILLSVFVMLMVSVLED